MHGNGEIRKVRTEGGAESEGSQEGSQELYTAVDCLEPLRMTVIWGKEPEREEDQF